MIINRLQNFRSHFNGWPMICLFFLLLTASCNKNKSANFYRQVFNEADDIYHKGNARTAMNFVDSVFLVNSDAPPYYEYKRYNLKKLFYYYSHIYDSNDMYIDSELYALESNKITHKYPNEYADALNSKGDYYYGKNDLNKAFQYYYRSKVAAMETKDSCAFANHSYHLGMVSYRQEKYKDAISFFKQTLAENHGCGKDSIAFYQVEELLNNIALAFTQLKNYDSAVYYYHGALDYLDRERQRYGSTVEQFSEMATGVIYGNLAKVYTALGQTDTAKHLLLKSIEINSKPGYDNNDALYARMQLAELYYKLRDLPLTIDLLHQVNSILDTLPNENVSLRLRNLVYRYYNETGDPQKALQAIQSYLQLKDSIDARDKLLKQTDVSQFLKNQEAQYQLDLLTKNNQLNRLYLAITLGFSILTIIIIVLIFYNYRRSRRSVQQLTVLNHQVNEQKEQLEFTMNELRKLNREKDRIMHVVAHDLRNPIGGMLALCDIILDEPLDDSQKESWEMMKTTAQLSLKLINRLSEMGSEMMQENVGKKELAELNDITKHVTSLLQYKANEKKQRLVLAPYPQPLNIFAQKERIWRVLSNVIGNAIKFSPENAVIYITVKKDDSHVTVEIKDKGMGIPEHLQPYVFDMFTKAKRTGTKGETSFGLGLSICRQIIEDNNGALRFESKEGVGTTFFITLPLTEITGVKGS
jgi:signal transduction histidine kinase